MNTGHEGTLGFSNRVLGCARSGGMWTGFQGLRWVLVPAKIKAVAS